MAKILKPIPIEKIPPAHPEATVRTEPGLDRIADALDRLEYGEALPIRCEMVKPESLQQTVMRLAARAKHEVVVTRRGKTLYVYLEAATI